MRNFWRRNKRKCKKNTKKRKETKKPKAKGKKKEQKPTFLLTLFHLVKMKPQVLFGEKNFKIFYTFLKDY